MQGPIPMVRYVLVNGVGRWGLPTGVLFTLLQSRGSDDIVVRAAVNLASFGVAGVFFGLVTWRSRGRQHLAPAASPVGPLAASAPISGSSVEVSTARAGVIGAALVILLGAAMVFTFRENPVLSVLALLPLAVGVRTIVVLAGKIRADHREIELRTVAGRFALMWKDVTEVDVDQNGTPLLLSAGGRRLPLPDRLYWSGTGKAALERLIGAQISGRNIPSRQNKWVHYSWPRGVRRDSPAG